MSASALRDIQVFVQTRSWHDVLDILVVAFLLYRFLLLIRGTRAVQLSAGLGVLVLIGLLAQVLRLELTAFIFRNLAPALLIGVVILFQPELRRALDRVGRVGLMGRPLVHYNLQMLGRLIDEMVLGVTRLAEQRVGALIAVEREVGIENHALTGVRLNSDVSAEMIQTVFFPNSPLHDGAAIVRGNKIVAAGCLLPLVDEVAYHGRLGTRHRAALGLSLESDALVIVVSEETGRISIARDGQLRRGLNPEELRQILMATLMPRAGGGGPRIFGPRRRRAGEPNAQVQAPTPAAPIADGLGDGPAVVLAAPVEKQPAEAPR
ncbi:MAG TPA: diadenylate cyclase CdaA [Candidatus Dormibacteraeota bacterium]|jgi:diadenylate cyclase|nr:diadenylate cyclase CdaA [Candidatus Dormibacteraeota bacterium]